MLDCRFSWLFNQTFEVHLYDPQNFISRDLIVLVWLAYVLRELYFRPTDVWRWQLLNRLSSLKKFCELCTCKYVPIRVCTCWFTSMTYVRIYLLFFALRPIRRYVFHSDFEGFRLQDQLAFQLNVWVWQQTLCFNYVGGLVSITQLDSCYGELVGQFGSDPWQLVGHFWIRSLTDCRL